MKRAIYTVLLVLACCGAVFAAQDAPADAAASVPFWQSLLVGAIAGAIAAVTGYAKNRDPITGAKEPFEWRFAVPTVVIGMLVGVAANLWGGNDIAGLMARFELSPIFGMLMMGVEAVLKAFFRNGVPLVTDIWKTIKAGAQSPPSTPPKP